MEATQGMHALKSLFGFPFRDEKWGIKFLIGSLLYIGGFILPIVPWIALWGYLARVIRSGVEAEGPLRLPEWEDWGRLFLDGLKLMLASFLLSLPGLIVITIGFGSYFGMMIASMMVQSVASEEALGPIFVLTMLSIGVMFFSMTLGTILSLVSWLFIPPSMAHVAVTGKLGAFFAVSQWGGIFKKNFSGFLMVLFVMFALWALQYLVFYLIYMTVILCFLIPVLMAPMVFYMLVVSGVITGQAYREGQDQLAPKPASEVLDGAAI